MESKKMSIYLAVALLAIALLAPQALAQAANQGAVIYKNEACSHCLMYLMEFHYAAEQMGLPITEKSMINNPAIRAELTKFNQERGIPLEMQGHMVTVIGGLVLEGHVPVSMVEEYIKANPSLDFPDVVVYQDYMLPLEELKTYKVMLNGEIKELPISTTIQDAVASFGESKGRVPQSFLLPLVLATGFLDGINPCAFGVLLFFIALLYTLRWSRFELFKIGIIYIVMIYLAYFLIGLGILQAISFFDFPHAVAYASAVAMFALGAVNIKDFFWPGRWFSLSIPVSQTGRIKSWMSKMTLPSVIVVGFLVGLCTFPCSGGIYVGILSLLTVSTTYWTGLVYLVLYNIMFVVPLVIVLLLASNRKVVGKMKKWQADEKKWMKLMSGLVMVGLGLLLLYFV